MLPFVSGYMSPGKAEQALPGTTVVGLVARGYHEPAVHLGAWRVAGPNFVDIAVVASADGRHLELSIGGRRVEGPDGMAIKFHSIDHIMGVMHPGVESVLSLALAGGAFSSVKWFRKVLGHVLMPPPQLQTLSASGAWFEHNAAAALVVASHLCAPMDVGGLLRIDAAEFVAYVCQLLGPESFDPAPLDLAKALRRFPMLPPLSAVTQRVRAEVCDVLAGVCGLERTSATSPYDAVAYPLFVASADEIRDHREDEKRELAAARSKAEDAREAAAKQLRLASEARRNWVAAQHAAVSPDASHWTKRAAARQLAVAKAKVDATEKAYEAARKAASDALQAAASWGTDCEAWLRPDAVCGFEFKVRSGRYTVDELYTALSAKRNRQEQRVSSKKRVPLIGVALVGGGVTAIRVANLIAAVVLGGEPDVPFDLPQACLGTFSPMTPPPGDETLELMVGAGIPWAVPPTLLLLFLVPIVFFRSCVRFDVVLLPV